MQRFDVKLDDASKKILLNLLDELERKTGKHIEEKHKQKIRRGLTRL